MECPHCGETVPDGQYCTECGRPLNEEPLSLGSRKYEILTTFEELHEQDKKLLQSEDIADAIGKSRDTVRTLMYQLHKDGYLDRPVWGRYKITDRGKGTTGEGAGLA